jgi:hypothetical protein
MQIGRAASECDGISHTTVPGNAGTRHLTPETRHLVYQIRTRSAGARYIGSPSTMSKAS